ncbi:MAG: hypothetical protein KQI78_08110 [Deltaproteobacteria bacterium]|jgi:hypothetical protein|nr:hypothetical protein [Deltaproteobacteria bacterium]
MEYIIAAGVIALVAAAAYILQSKSRSTTTRPVQFTCRHCGEKHCQCEPQD